MNNYDTTLGLVVVVDDETIITRPVVRLLRRLLKEQRLHYEIVASQSPQEAFNKIETSHNDLALVISDLMMEPIDGLEFLRMIKSKYPQALLIVLTGYADQHAFRVLKEEFELYGYQEKPWNDDEFKRVIKNALDSHRRRRLLNRYVPEEIVKSVLENPHEGILEGLELEATILFLDIRDSTALFDPAIMEAKEALRYINLYFKEMLEVLDKYENGILDKFMGDGIMALFGLPPSNSRAPAADARDAVLAALEMRERVQRLNQQKLGVPLKIGIGLSTGLVIAGNIGTEKRANYTVLGKDVNIASRLEKAAKPIEDGILMSHSTYAYVKDIVTVEPYQGRFPQDKSTNNPVYKVLGLSPSAGG